jgi:hypothetical protein
MRAASVPDSVRAMSLPDRCASASPPKLANRTQDSPGYGGMLGATLHCARPCKRKICHDLHDPVPVPTFFFFWKRACAYLGSTTCLPVTLWQERWDAFIFLRERETNQAITYSKAPHHTSTTERVKTHQNILLKEYLKYDDMQNIGGNCTVTFFCEKGPLIYW